ncbi:MAG: hypothetical protein ACYC49_17655 [Ignavibacteriaceae bacterium]
MKNEINNQYLEYSYEELRVELFRRRISMAKMGKYLNRTGMLISYVLNDKANMSRKAKEKMRIRICRFLTRQDMRKRKR